MYICLCIYYEIICCRRTSRRAHKMLCIHSLNFSFNKEHAIIQTIELSYTPAHTHTNIFSGKPSYFIFPFAYKYDYVYRVYCERPYKQIFFGSYTLYILNTAENIIFIVRRTQDFLLWTNDFLRIIFLVNINKIPHTYKRIDMNRFRLVCS